jgi:hypothetical protein
VPPLQGPAGVTSLSGRALTANDSKALPGVTLELICGSTTKSASSDATGRFLITSIGSGHCKLEIDGSTAGQAGKTYGIFFAGVTITPSQTFSLRKFRL